MPPPGVADTAPAARRFRDDLERLITVAPDARIGIAVSGGPDSFALLLLAHAAYGPQMAAATVDHRLRAEAAAEASHVGTIAAARGIPHSILTAEWPSGAPHANVQEAARDVRYALLARWAEAEGLAAVLTAHHADDQAETLLMRLGRGSGLSGLAGVRAVQGGGPVPIVRPLLGWRRSELAEICAAARIVPVDDPSNADDRFDRTRIRRLLGGADALDPLAVAESAAHLDRAEQALAWAVEEAAATRVRRVDGRAAFRIEGLPFEIKRRILARLIEESGTAPRGGAVARAVERLDRSETTTLAGAKIVPGAEWMVSAAPSRRGN